jgi:tellurite resistance-related uncharacterized protein
VLTRSHQAIQRGFFIKTLPDNVVSYSKTPEFSESTVPKGLLKDHQTKEGVWGEIVILEGRLEYTIIEPELEVLELSASKFGVVEPTILHHVRPLGKVRFYVEFYR